MSYEKNICHKFINNQQIYSKQNKHNNKIQRILIRLQSWMRSLGILLYFCDAKGHEIYWYFGSHFEWYHLVITR